MRSKKDPTECRSGTHAPQKRLSSSTITTPDGDNMHRPIRKRTTVKTVVFILVFSLCTFTLRAQTTGRTAAYSQASPEQRTARYFESLRKSPPQMLAFLLQMPKGGDLHNHLSGAIYAESYIKWAAENGLCINTMTMALSPPAQSKKCDPDSSQPPVSSALLNAILYRQMIDAWSMRNWQFSGQSGHDHFFDTFVKFGPATWNQAGKMLAEAVARAGRGHVLYM